MCVCGSSPKISQLGMTKTRRLVLLCARKGGTNGPKYISIVLMVIKDDRWCDGVNV